MSLQRIRPALDKLDKEMSLNHALAGVDRRMEVRVLGRDQHPSVIVVRRVHELEVDIVEGAR